MNDQQHRKSARVIPPRPPVKWDRTPMTRGDYWLLVCYAAVWGVVIWILGQAL